MYTEQDHADLQLAHDHLHLASELINGVMERRRLDLNLQTLSLLSEAKRDADNADREAGMAGRYMGWLNDGQATA